MRAPLWIFSVMIGIVQSLLGGILSVVAYIVYSDQAVQASIGVTSREAPLYMFVILVIGVFLILSGLMLVSEENVSKEAATA